MKRETRKKWEFTMAVIRTLFNILGFAVSFLVFWKVWR